MGCLKLDLRLARLTEPPKVPAICEVQAPSTLVGHEVDDLKSSI